MISWSGTASSKFKVCMIAICCIECSKANRLRLVSPPGSSALSLVKRRCVRSWGTVQRSSHSPDDVRQPLGWTAGKLWRERTAATASIVAVLASWHALAQYVPGSAGHQQNALTSGCAPPSVEAPPLPPSSLPTAPASGLSEPGGAVTPIRFVWPSLALPIRNASACPPRLFGASAAAAVCSCGGASCAADEALTCTLPADTRPFGTAGNRQDIHRLFHPYGEWQNAQFSP